MNKPLVYDGLYSKNMDRAIHFTTQLLWQLILSKAKRSEIAMEVSIRSIIDTKDQHIERSDQNIDTYNLFLANSCALDFLNTSTISMKSSIGFISTA